MKWDVKVLQRMTDQLGHGFQDKSVILDPRHPQDGAKDIIKSFNLQNNGRNELFSLDNINPKSIGFNIHLCNSSGPGFYVLNEFSDQNALIKENVS